ncbi:hypothetical protein Hypma_000745 [Hypsizygus marmoreus]|uniref:Uncharacterized protein n=1 Tax=Hypsizygus marmoreus TaxID=39966 RepID=A0A369JC40_HYPMA|nr:hypothetical protein Hypma_000745 [Hypsizygus marmoreus]
MTSYFHVSTRPRRPLQRDALSVEPRSTFDSSALDNSVYVFPNPPSAPPSPSQLSDLSAPTDFTSSSAISETPTMDSGLPDVHERQHDFPSPLSPLSSMDDVHDIPWTPKGADEILLRAANDSIERIDRWQQLIRRRAKEPMKSRSHSRSSDMLKPRHHTFDSLPSIRLLSFFVYLFSIDETTLRLLSHPSAEAALFPGQSQLSDSDKGAANELHGTEKLLIQKSESRVVRDGCALVSDPNYPPYHPFSSLPFVGLWGLVTGFVSNSGKAFREVLQS